MYSIGEDRSKYFLDSNKQPIYVREGYLHHDLARQIISMKGLDDIYYKKYRELIDEVSFIICLGYVLVDEAQVSFDIKDIHESVVYCSKVIGDDYVDFLKRKYNDNTYLEDAFVNDEEDAEIRERIQNDKTIAQILKSQEMHAKQISESDSQER